MTDKNYSDDTQDPNAKIWYVFKGVNDHNYPPSICMVTTAANPNKDGWAPWVGPYTRQEAKNFCKNNCKSCAG